MSGYSINHIYLQLGFTQGSVTEEEHRGWIEVTGFTFTMAHGSGDRGGDSGYYSDNSRPHFAPLTISKLVDKSSPDILMNCATGTQTAKVVLDVCDTKGTFYRYILRDAKIISVNAKTADNYTLSEELKLNYASIYSWYQSRDTKGNIGLSSEGGYSLKDNKPIFKS